MKRRSLWIWIPTIIYVLSPLDLDPGLPFTDAGALAVAVLLTKPKRK